MVDRKKVGFIGESLAADYLESKNYHIVQRNYRKPWGEIDLIASKDGILAFVEVKTNTIEYTSTKAFSPELRVNRDKVGKILKTATLYMQYEQKGKPLPWQIDIVSVTFHRDQRKAKLIHFKNVAGDMF